MESEDNCICGCRRKEESQVSDSDKGDTKVVGRKHFHIPVLRLVERTREGQSIDVSYTRSGRSTVCELNLVVPDGTNGDIVAFRGVGVSVCNTTDRDRSDIGDRLSLSRALHQIATDISRDTFAIVHERCKGHNEFGGMTDTELAELRNQVTGEIQTRNKRKAHNANKKAAALRDIKKSEDGA